MRKWKFREVRCITIDHILSKGQDWNLHPGLQVPKSEDYTSEKTSQWATTDMLLTIKHMVSESYY